MALWDAWIGKKNYVGYCFYFYFYFVFIVCFCELNAPISDDDDDDDDDDDEDDDGKALLMLKIFTNVIKFYSNFVHTSVKDFLKVTYYFYETIIDLLLNN